MYILMTIFHLESYRFHARSTSGNEVTEIKTVVNVLGLRVYGGTGLFEK